jgi:hypothetical protein
VTAAKKKGTAFENELLADLRAVFGPGVDRAKAGNESNDFTGIGFPVEAKHRKTWDLKGWIRKIRPVAAAGAHPALWVLFAADGDRRRGDSVGTVMVVDIHFGMELLGHWALHNGLTGEPDHD